MDVKQYSANEIKQVSLPFDWRWVKLGRICEIIAGQSPPGHTYRDTPGGLPFFQGKADFSHRNPVPRAWCIEPTKIAYSGDILISVRAPVGPTNIADQECCIGRGLAAIRCGDGLDREFLLFWLKREEKALAQKGNGSTFGAINRKDLEDFLIPLPSLSEQKRIAGILNERMAAIDKARAAAEARLVAAKMLPEAYLRQVFPQEGLPLPPGWDWAKMGEICEIQLGKMLSPKSKLGIESFPYLRNANVQWNRVDTTDVACMDFSKAEQEKFRLKEGDLLICEGGEPGRSAIWDGRMDPCYYQKSLHRLRPINNLVDPQFALFRMWIGVLRGEFISANVQTTIAHLPAIRLESLAIPLPSLSEQKRIVAILNEQMAYAKRLESSLNRQLSEINTLPQALLRQAFNGEL